MAEQTALKEILKPVGISAFAVLFLGLISSELFAMAKKTEVPVNPAALTTVALQVDQVEACPRFAPIPRNAPIAALRCLYSHDYQGVTFQLQGAAMGVSFTPAERVELLVHRDPSEIAGRQQGRSFDVMIPVKVHGVRKGGELLADPEPAYEQAVSRKTLHERLGWAALLMALGAAAFAFRAIRRILREDRW